MFKRIEDLLKEMQPEAKINVYFHGIRSMIGNINVEAITETCFMYEFEHEEMSVQISTINKEYPMQSLVITKLITNDGEEKKEKIEYFVKEYVKKLSENEHHSLLNVYDLTDVYTDVGVPIHFWLAPQLATEMDKKIIGSGKEYIKRKIKELKQYN